MNNAAFTAANQVGDDGTALREASLGRKFSFDLFMAQNSSSVASGINTVKTGAINNSSGYAAGIATVTTNGFTGAVATGAWVTFAGDGIPHQITAHTETLGNTTAITFIPPLATAVVNTAVVTAYTPGSVATVGGYPVGWSKAIAYTGFSVVPQVGQLVTFNTAVNIYSVIQVDTVNGTITLDRPLDLAIAYTDAINIGPAGEYNFAFHRNALALVCRPLSLPRPGIGAQSAVVNLNGLSVRATITYNGLKQGTLVTLDMLLGIAVLDTHLGAVMLG